MKRIVSILSSVFFAVAAGFAMSACVIRLYEPKVPQKLLDKIS